MDNFEKIIIKQEVDIDVSDKSEDENTPFEPGLIHAEAVYDTTENKDENLEFREPKNKRTRTRPKRYDEYIAHETFNFGTESYSVPSTSDANQELKNDISAMTNFVNEDLASTSTEKPARKNKRAWARKYNEGYLKFGFICTTDNQEDKPQCVICGVVLANESLKPSKLKRHLETKHGDLVDKPLEYFQNRKTDLKITTQSIPKTPNKNDKALLASYLVAYRVAKERLPHTTAENVLPASMDMVREIFDEESAEKMKTIPLSNTTVSRRISDIADHMETILISRLQSCEGFAIQLDESTEISNNIMLLVYVRYLFEETFMEDLLCCLSLPVNATEQQIFTALNDCVVGKYMLSWTNCKCVTSDGGDQLTGSHSYVVTKILEASDNNAIWNHCFIHVEPLVSKGIPYDFSDALKEVIKIVNFIKANSPKSKLFELIYAEMGGTNTHLLLHTEIRWLAKGKVLAKLYELRDHVNVFLVTRKSNSTNLFSNNIWLMKLAYLADIFIYINDLILKLQDKDNDLFSYWQHIQFFQKSLLLWQAKLKNNRSGFYMFPTLSKHIEENNIDEHNLNEVKFSIQVHLAAISHTFSEYFPSERIEIVQKHLWVKDPFAFENPESIIDLNFLPEEENEFLQLTCDITIKNKFKSSSLVGFWVSAQKDYPLLSRSAILLLLPFITTQICEVGFSTLTGLKTKKRNRLATAPDLRVALSTCTIDWNEIIKNKQAHPSH